MYEVVTNRRTEMGKASDRIPESTIDYADMYLEYQDYFRKMKTVIKVLAPKTPAGPFAVLLGYDGTMWVVFRNEFGSVFHKLQKKSEIFLKDDTK